MVINLSTQYYSNKKGSVRPLERGELKRFNMKIIILLAAAAVIALISYANDKCIEKKGGETEYIWEKH